MKRAGGADNKQNRVQSTVQNEWMNRPRPGWGRGREVAQQLGGLFRIKRPLMRRETEGAVATMLTF